MIPLLESLLTLCIACFGFYCIGYGVGIFKTHPAKVLDLMIRRATAFLFWLVKVILMSSFELVSAYVRGAPADTVTATNTSSAFLTGIDRFKLLNRWKRDGLVLDGKRKLSLRDAFRHVAVFGPTGGGKTSSVILPAILNLKAKNSVVINDPSGELFAKASGWLNRQGFTVRTINVSDVEHSLSFNPLVRADSHTAIAQVADVLVHHAFPDSKGDPFWSVSARGLISILIRFLKHEPEHCNLHNLRFLLNSFGENGRPLNKWIAKQPVDEATWAEWKGIISASPKVLQSVVSTAKAALDKVSDPSIARLTATETLHFEDLRKRPTAIFIIVPEHETRHWAFLTDLLLLQIFSFCMEPKRPNEPYLPVFFLLDEFGHARLPGFSTATVTMRKRECSICILLQEPAMLEQTYGKADTATILGGGMVSKIFMPGLSLEVTERLSRLIGKGDDNRPVLSPSAIRTLPDNTSLLIHGSRKPVLLKMTPYFKNAKLLRRTRIPPAPLPENMASAELAFLSLDHGNCTQDRNKVEYAEETDTEAHSKAVETNPRAAAPGPLIATPASQNARVEPAPSTGPTESADPLSAPKHGDMAPRWASELLQEQRRARQEVEDLREAIGTREMPQQEAGEPPQRSVKTSQHPETEVVVLTPEQVRDLVKQAAQHGASESLLKVAGDLEQLREILEGQRGVLSKAQCMRLMQITSDTTYYQRCREGLPYYTVGKQRFHILEEVMEWIRTVSEDDASERKTS